MRAIVDALKHIGTDIADIVIVIKKVGGENALEAVDPQVKTLINVDVVDGQVVIEDEYGDG